VWQIAVERRGYFVARRNFPKPIVCSKDLPWGFAGPGDKWWTNARRSANSLVVNALISICFLPPPALQYDSAQPRVEASYRLPLSPEIGNVVYVDLIAMEGDSAIADRCFDPSKTAVLPWRKQFELGEPPETVRSALVKSTALSRSL